MGNFKLKIDLGNALMNSAEDIDHALKQVQLQLERGLKEGKVSDPNGNTVGAWKITSLTYDKEK